MRVRDFKETLDHIKSLVNAPPVNIMLIIGFLLFVLSFSKFDGIRGFSLQGSPNGFFLVVGLLFLIGGPAIFVLTREDRRIDRKATIQKGISLSFNQLSVNLVVGKIEEIPQLSRDSAVVLPANSSFIDDCLTDPKSALGAFFLKYYGERLSKISKDLEAQLQIQGYQKDSKGFYPLGTTVILPEDYDTPAKCLVTACTYREELTGIRAEPSSLCECVKQVFAITSDKKIEKLYMPVLGSGHGGLDIDDALLFLILSIKYYSRKFHHIKSIYVMVREDDVPRLKDLWRLQYITLLKEG